MFDIETQLERNPKTQQLDERAHGVGIRYTAVLGDREAFTPALWALAVACDAPTVRNRATVQPGSGILPRMCVRMAAKLSTGFMPSNTWRKPHRPSIPLRPILPNAKAGSPATPIILYMGRVHKIIAALHKRNRPELATYVETHQRRIQYLEFREEGFPIGSGTVESAVKQFKHRLAGSVIR